MDSGRGAFEVGGPVGGRPPLSSYRRRTTLRAWCGVIFLTALSACTSSDSPASRSNRVVTIGVPESGVNVADLGIGSLVITSTLEGLTDLSESSDGRALPKLAARWAWENDGRRLRLTLRPDVLFHDGTPLTAAIAANALSEAIKRPDNLSLYPSLTDITAVRAEGASDVVLELLQPSAFLPEELDFPLSTKDGTVGTGPFRLVQRDGAGAVLERFDRYYRGLPEIERIVIRPFETLRPAWTSLLRGDVDVVTNVPPDAVEFIQNDAIQVIPFARRYQFLIAFNVRRPPFTSPVVRRALNFAIDRESLIEKVLQGQGQAATGPLWPQHWAYDTTIPPYSFDQTLATQLLDQAGLTAGRVTGTEESAPARLRFNCLLPANFSLLERVALDIQKQLFDVGVDIQFEVVTPDEYTARIREGRFEAVFVDLISGPTFGRPYIFWRSAREFRGLNIFGYENSEAERLFQVLRTSMNEAAFRSATRRLQRVLLADPPAVFLAWNSRARAVSRDFRVPAAPGRDPLLTIWQWTDNPDRPAVSPQ